MGTAQLSADVPEKSQCSSFAHLNSQKKLVNKVKETVQCNKLCKKTTLAEPACVWQNKPHFPEFHGTAQLVHSMAQAHEEGMCFHVWHLELGEGDGGDLLQNFGKWADMYSRPRKANQAFFTTFF